MARKDRRVDAYIKRAAPFASPILKHLRKVVHAGLSGCRRNDQVEFTVLRAQGNHLFYGRLQAALRFWFLERRVDLWRETQRRDGAFRPDHFDQRFAGWENVGRLRSEGRRTKRSRR